MTVAVTIKISDGVVLATDSAQSMVDGNNQVFNIYNNGNKLFNLHKKLPIGAATWGAGNIGMSTLVTIVKDFRKLMTTESSEYFVDVNNYTIEEVANSFFVFLMNKYESIGNLTSHTGFYVSGYSSNEDFPETWAFMVRENPIVPKVLKSKEDTGINWKGQEEAINRIVYGIPTALTEVMKHVGIEENKIDQALELLVNIVPVQLATPFMPIQDAIDLSDFLVQTTIKYVQFTPGSPTVGGPTDIAVITKHEGFKWIKRKHFYNENLNPKEV